MARGPILGGIELAGLMISEPWEFSGVRSVVEISVGGYPNIWDGEVSGWVFSVFSPSQNHGVLKKSVIDAVYELSSHADATYLFDNNRGEVFDVRFAHHEGQVISATPVGNVISPDENTYYNNINIKLMRMS